MRKEQYIYKKFFKLRYKLRFVQHFKQEYVKEYLAMEKDFEKLEAEAPNFPKGRRYLPVTGREASNTLIWECDFDSLEAAQQALSTLMNDDRHEALFNQQSQYILKTYTEIYKPFDV